MGLHLKNVTRGQFDVPVRLASYRVSMTLPVDDSVIERETRWLREAGHSFAAALLDGLWNELQRYSDIPEVNVEGTVEVEDGDKVEG